jgi:hypothetical protein
MGERVGDLHRVAEHIARWQRAPSEPVIERFALEILHHKVRPAVLIAYIEQRADVWVTEGGDRARLGLEPRTAIRPFGQFRVQQFDRNRSLQSRIPRLVASPIPPTPMSDRISYGPSFAPRVSVIGPSNGLSKTHENVRPPCRGSRRPASVASALAQFDRRAWALRPAPSRARGRRRPFRDRGWSRYCAVISWGPSLVPGARAMPRRHFTRLALE